MRPEALRLLQVAAEESQSLAFVFRPLKAAKQSSAAPLCMICKPILSVNARTMNRREWMQTVMLEIEIVKRRNLFRAKPLQLCLPIQTPALPAAPREEQESTGAQKCCG